MLSANQLAELVIAADAVQAGALTRQRYDEIIGSLTPEQRAVWEQICPDVLDPNVVFQAADSGGGWKR